MDGILKKVKEVFSNTELRNKILFSLGMLVVYRILIAIPVVGIPANSIKSLFGGSSFGELLSVVSGGVLDSASMLTLGLTPYINSSIALQLLSYVIPQLEELRKEGSEGQRKISMYTRWASLPLALLQTFAIYSTLLSLGLVTDLSTLQYLAMVSVMVAGAMTMMWLAELISEMGLGNGSSLIIMFGVLAPIPGAITQTLDILDIYKILVLIGLMVGMITLVIFVSAIEKKIAVIYSSMVKSYSGANENYLSIKPMQAGVMPAIFAISLFSFPQILAKLFISQNWNATLTAWSTTLLSWIENPWIFDIGVGILTFAFTFFYVSITFNAEEQAERIQKAGAFIKSLRPGKQTADYLRSESMKTAVPGAIFIAFLAIAPNILVNSGVFSTYIFTGTGLLILGSALLDIRNQLNSLTLVRSYSKYVR